MNSWVNELPRFDALYAVSDLHMGGAQPGAQIFDSSPQLAALIRHLAAIDGNLALVINGDFVDFLAEPGAVAFDGAGAVTKLKRISEDASFAPVWLALREFVAKPRRQLAITLGNHDLELALPWVRTALLDLLAPDDAAKGRITLAFDGAGFRCRVGKANVLCIHGNEVDDWNLTDHETIRRHGRDLLHDRAVESWVPNAGTGLVIDVMNDIKRDHPFVDLLKPELEAVIPVLFAVAPEKRGRIKGALPAIERLLFDKARRAIGWLGADEEASGAAPSVRMRRRIDRDALLTAAETYLTNSITPMQLVREAGPGDFLSWSGALWNWAWGGDARETLRQALSDLAKDRSFEWSQADATYRDIDARIGPEVDFILAGHTHLERALARHRKRGFYFNSGTWARLIRLESAVLGNPTRFNKLHEALAAGDMASLDRLDGLVERRRTVIEIRADAKGAGGRLMHWAGDGAAAALQSVDANAGMTIA